MLTGKKIKLLRQIHGYTQEELASKIGRTRALVSHIEQSDKINHDTLLLILKLFKLSEEEFKHFDNTGLKKPKSKDYSTNEEPVLQLKEKLTGYQKEISGSHLWYHDKNKLSPFKPKNWVIL